VIDTLRSNSQLDLDILIIDDNKSFASLLARFMSLRGCNVIVSHTLADSISILKDKKPDIVILDPTFRNYTKDETLTEFQKHNFLQNHKIIIFGGTCEPTFIDKWKPQGLYSYLEKPTEIENIMNFLKRESLNKKQYKDYENNKIEIISQKHVQTIPDNSKESIIESNSAMAFSTTPVSTTPSTTPVSTTPSTTPVSTTPSTTPSILDQKRKEKFTVSNDHESLTISNKLNSIISNLVYTKSDLKHKIDNPILLKKDAQSLTISNKLNSIISNLVYTKSDLKHKIDNFTTSDSPELEKKEIETELRKLTTELSDIKNEIYLEPYKKRPQKSKKQEPTTKFKKLRKKKHLKKNKHKISSTR
jgi:ActR/RegA family two-component response regulator